MDLGFEDESLDRSIQPKTQDELDLGFESPPVDLGFEQTPATVPPSDLGFSTPEQDFGFQPSEPVTPPTPDDARLQQVQSETFDAKIKQDSTERKQNEGFFKEFGRSLAAGTAGLAKQGLVAGKVAVDLPEMLSSVKQEHTENGTLDKAISYFEQVQNAHSTPTDLQGSVWDKPELLVTPAWWGSMVGGMIPGVAEMLVASKIGGGIAPANAAKLGQTLGAGLAVGALQAGPETYLDLKKRGADDKDAAKGYAMSTFVNGVLGFMWFNKALDASVAKFPGKAALIMSLGNAVQSAAAAPTEYAILNVMDKLNQDEELSTYLKEGLNAFVVGGVTGALMSKLLPKGITPEAANKQLKDMTQKIKDSGPSSDTPTLNMDTDTYLNEHDIPKEESILAHQANMEDPVGRKGIPKKLELVSDDDPVFQESTGKVHGEDLLTSFRMVRVMSKALGRTAILVRGLEGSDALRTKHATYYSVDNPERWALSLFLHEEWSHGMYQSAKKEAQAKGVKFNETPLGKTLDSIFDYVHDKEAFKRIAKDLDKRYRTSLEEKFKDLPPEQRSTAINDELREEFRAKFFEHYADDVNFMRRLLDTDPGLFHQLLMHVQAFFEYMRNIVGEATNNKKLEVPMGENGEYTVDQKNRGADVGVLSDATMEALFGGKLGAVQDTMIQAAKLYTDQLKARTDAGMPLKDPKWDRIITDIAQSHEPEKTAPGETMASKKSQKDIDKKLQETQRGMGLRTFDPSVSKGNKSFDYFKGIMQTILDGGVANDTDLEMFKGWIKKAVELKWLPPDWKDIADQKVKAKQEFDSLELAMKDREKNGAPIKEHPAGSPVKLVAPSGDTLRVQIKGDTPTHWITNSGSRILKSDYPHINKDSGKGWIVNVRGKSTEEQLYHVTDINEDKNTIRGMATRAGETEVSPRTFVKKQGHTSSTRWATPKEVELLQVPPPEADKKWFNHTAERIIAARIEKMIGVNDALIRKHTAQRTVKERTQIAELMRTKAQEVASAEQHMRKAMEPMFKRVWQELALHEPAYTEELKSRYGDFSYDRDTLVPNIQLRNPDGSATDKELNFRRLLLHKLGSTLYGKAQTGRMEALQTAEYTTEKAAEHGVEVDTRETLGTKETPEQLALLGKGTAKEKAKLQVKAPTKPKTTLKTLDQISESGFTREEMRVIENTIDEDGYFKPALSREPDFFEHLADELGYDDKPDYPATEQAQEMFWNVVGKVYPEAKAALESGMTSSETMPALRRIPRSPQEVAESKGPENDFYNLVPKHFSSIAAKHSKPIDSTGYDTSSGDTWVRNRYNDFAWAKTTPHRLFIVNELLKGQDLGKEPGKSLFRIKSELEKSMNEQGLLDFDGPMAAKKQKEEEFTQTLRDVLEGKEVKVYHGTDRDYDGVLPKGRFVSLSLEQAKRYPGPARLRPQPPNAKVFEGKIEVPRHTITFKQAEEFLNKIESGELSVDEAIRLWDEGLREVQTDVPLKINEVPSKQSYDYRAESPDAAQQNTEEGVAKWRKAGIGLDDKAAPVVKYLNEKGIVTTQSGGHSGYITIPFWGSEAEVNLLSSIANRSGFDVEHNYGDVVLWNGKRPERLGDGKVVQHSKPLHPEDGKIIEAILNLFEKRNDSENMSSLRYGTRRTESQQRDFVIEERAKAITDAETLRESAKWIGVKDFSKGIPAEKMNLAYSKLLRLPKAMKTEHIMAAVEMRKALFKLKAKDPANKDLIAKRGDMLYTLSQRVMASKRLEAQRLRIKWEGAGMSKRLAKELTQATINADHKIMDWENLSIESAKSYAAMDHEERSARLTDNLSNMFLRHFTQLDAEGKELPNGYKDVDSAVNGSLIALKKELGNFEDPNSGINIDMSTKKGMETVGKYMKGVSMVLAGRGDKVLEYWKNSILSGFSTVLQNPVSNLMRVGYEFGPKGAIEAAINKSMFALSGGKIGDDTAFQKFGIEAKSLLAMQTSKDYFEHFWKAMKSEVPTYRGSKFDATITHSIGGVLGRIIRTPQTTLMAADDAFKLIVVDAKLKSIAFDELVQLGKETTDANILKKMQEYASNMESPQFQDAVQYSVEMLWQAAEDGSWTQKAIQSIVGARENMPGGHYILPFVVTPLNLISSGLRMSPLGLARLIAKAAGGKYKKTPERFASDLAEQALAWSTLLAVKALMGDDDDPSSQKLRITGSEAYWSSNKSKSAFQTYDQMPPMTIRLFGKDVSYARIEPLATIMPPIIDALYASNRIKDGQDPTEAVAEAVGKTLAAVQDKSFISSLHDIIEATSSEGVASQKLAKWIGNFSVSWAPNLVKQVSKATDPYMRDTSVKGKPLSKEWALDWLAKQKYAVMPMMANTLPPYPKYDPWGNPYVKSNSEPSSDLMYRLTAMAGIAITMPRTKKVNMMLQKWNETNRFKYIDPVTKEPSREFYPDRPDRSIASGLTSVLGTQLMINLNDEQYQQYVKLIGEYSKNAVNGTDFNIENPGIADINKLKHIRENATKTARLKLLGMIRGRP